MTQCCHVCRFFSDREAPDSGWGRCRYNPPVVVSHHDDAAEFIQPKVQGRDWCGRFVVSKRKNVDAGKVGTEPLS